MTLHDLRNKIYKENESIKSNFPLKLGGFDLEIDQSYDITSNNIKLLTHILLIRYRNRNVSLQV